MAFRRVWSSVGTLVASFNRRGKQERQLRIDAAIDVAWLEMIDNCPMNRSCPRSAPVSRSRYISFDFPTTGGAPSVIISHPAQISSILSLYYLDVAIIKTVI